mgnify:CR=1 FL=1
MKNIKIIRLQTGEDIIGEVTVGDVVSIKKPFTIIPMQAQPGKPVQLVLTPWMPYTDDRELTIDDSKVITMATPKADILKSYEHNVSEIIGASKPGLITETNLPKL